MTLTFESGCGVRLHVGTLYSNVRLNVPSSSDVLVYQRTPKSVIGENSAGNNVTTRIFACDIYMVWNQSFVRSVDSRHGMRMPVRRVSGNGATSRIAPAEFVTGNGDRQEVSLMREEYDYDDDCTIAASGVEVYDRFLLVWMLSRPCRQTIKLQNSFGQKGVAHFADLSDLVTDRNEPVDVISSMYSLVGRSACGQLLEQRIEGVRKIYSRSTGKCLGSGGFGYFFISNDSTHNHFIYHTKHGGSNPMRMCRLTYESLLENCASSTAYVKGSDFESGITNPYAGMPRTVASALSCYSVYQRAMRLRSQRTANMRKRVYDIAFLQFLTACVPSVTRKTLAARAHDASSSLCSLDSGSGGGNYGPGRPSLPKSGGQVVQQENRDYLQHYDGNHEQRENGEQIENQMRQVSSNDLGRATQQHRRADGAQNQRDDLNDEIHGEQRKKRLRVRP